MTWPAAQHHCFAIERRLTRPGLAVSLDAKVAEALADLLPLLCCGEEAAVVGFDRLGRAGGLDPALRSTLRQIADDERRHDAILRGLRAALPARPQDRAVSSAPGISISICRAAAQCCIWRELPALDAAVCTILSRLLRPGAAISRDDTVRAVLSHIRQDETRHVMVSRRHRIGCGRPAGSAQRRRRGARRAGRIAGPWRGCIRGAWRRSRPAAGGHRAAARWPVAAMTSSAPHAPPWTSRAQLSVLGTGSALPGEPVATEALIALIGDRFGIGCAREALAVAQRLGIHSRHVCRDFTRRQEPARGGDSNPELAARAVKAALADAGIAIGDIGFLIGHTTTPCQPLPANIAHVADRLGYSGPHVELRQACTGFANALMIATGLLSAAGSRPVVIVGSETGSLFFDPQRLARRSRPDRQYGADGRRCRCHRAGARQQAGCSDRGGVDRVDRTGPQAGYPAASRRAGICP